MRPRKKLITAGVLSAVYLAWAFYMILHSALGGPAPMRWYEAGIATLPLSAVFYHAKSLPLFVVFALFNAFVLFLVSWGVVSVWYAVCTSRD
jgi:hypothetical protein